MSDRQRLYIVSILGISKRADDPDQPGKEVGRYIHVPLLIIETSLDNASEEACVQANRMFPESLGFKSKNITVQPIEPAAYLHLVRLSQECLLADSDEPVEQGCYFDCSLEEPDPGDNVILELGKEN